MAHDKQWLQVNIPAERTLPPSSLRLWHRALPKADHAYLGDFDQQFADEFFWSHRDTGKHGYSTASIARAGVALAYTIAFLADEGTSIPPTPNSKVGA